MAERAHPKLDGFKNHLEFRLRKGFIPWVSYYRNPYRAEFLWRYNWVNKYCKGKKILDVPCGMGWGLSRLTNARERVGIDISDEAINEARQRYEGIAQFEVGGMESLPFHDNSFDVVSCMEGIEHVQVEIGQRFVAEASRVLRPGALLLLSSPYCKDGKHSGNPYHEHEYQPDEIMTLLSRSFDINEWHEREVEALTIRYIKANPK